jgi:hypothetical protein
MYFGGLVGADSVVREVTIEQSRVHSQLSVVVLLRTWGVLGDLSASVRRIYGAVRSPIGIVWWLPTLVSTTFDMKRVLPSKAPGRDSKGGWKEIRQGQRLPFFVPSSHSRNPPTLRTD